MICYSNDPVAAIELTQRSVAGALRADLSEKRVSKMLVDMHKQVDAAIAAFFRESRVKSPCRPGCSFCCYIQVEAMVPEVILILRSILAKPHKVREAILSSAREAAAVVRTMSIEDRCEAKIPCPMLQDGQCSIYAVRPLSCRRFFVVDRSYCAKAFGVRDSEVPLIGEPYVLPTAAGAGMSLGLHDVGLFGGHVELISAIASASENPQGVFDAYMHGCVFGNKIDDVSELLAFLAQQRQQRYASSLISVTSGR